MKQLSDFLCLDCSFEVGARIKYKKKLQDIEKAFIAKDDISIRFSPISHFPVYWNFPFGTHYHLHASINTNVSMFIYLLN